MIGSQQADGAPDPQPVGFPSAARRAASPYLDFTASRRSFGSIVASLPVRNIPLNRILTIIDGLCKGNLGQAGDFLSCVWNMQENKGPDPPLHKTQQWGTPRGDSSIEDGQSAALAAVRHLTPSDVHDAAGGAGKLGEAIAVHAVIHEGAATFGQDEARVAQDFQMMRNGGLAQPKMLDDVTNADRIAIGGKQVEDADARRIGERLEPAGIFPGARASKLRPDWRGTERRVFRCAFAFCGHESSVRRLRDEKNSYHSSGHSGQPHWSSAVGQFGF